LEGFFERPCPSSSNRVLHLLRVFPFFTTAHFRKGTVAFLTVYVGPERASSLLFLLSSRSFGYPYFSLRNVALGNLLRRFCSEICHPDFPRFLFQFSFFVRPVSCFSTNFPTVVTRAPGQTNIIWPVIVLRFSLNGNCLLSALLPSRFGFLLFLFVSDALTPPVSLPTFS